MFEPYPATIPRLSSEQLAAPVDTPAPQRRDQPRRVGCELPESDIFLGLIPVHIGEQLVEGLYGLVVGHDVECAGQPHLADNDNRGPASRLRRPLQQATPRQFLADRSSVARAVGGSGSPGGQRVVVYSRALSRGLDCANKPDRPRGSS
jgi:hypothetical protein